MKESAVWWCSYLVNGRKVRESTGKRKQKEAADYLKQRLKGVGDGGPTPKEVARVMWDDLVWQLKSHYNVPRLRAVLERQWKRKKRIEQEQNIVVRHVFTYGNGSQIKSPGRAW